MISVVIPTLNAEAGLVACLSALVPAVVDGLVREVIIVDGGSTDHTCAIAEDAGCAVITGTVGGRGAGLVAGADRAKHAWLMFLHADTVLQEGWIREVATHIERTTSGAQAPAAAAFRFALDDVGTRPRIIEAGVAMRCAVFRLPYGDQGLLISKQLYHERGGFKPLPLMEDVDFILRLRRRELVMLRTAAVTSAVRYRTDGYTKRVLRNLTCLTLYAARVPVPTIQRIYHGRRDASKITMP
jgi:rSAM/selenodomain-associated transferase 2